MHQVYTIITCLSILFITYTIFRRVFLVGWRQIVHSFLRIGGAISAMLVIGNTYTLLLARGVLGITIITYVFRKSYRLALGVLGSLLLCCLILQYGWSNEGITLVAILTGLLIEENIKTTGIVVTPYQRFPYDGIIAGLILGSFFGIIEAGWAGWVNSYSQLRMRLSSSLSIHIVVTLSLIGIATYSKTHILYRVVLSVGAISIHLAYNTLQGSVIAIIPLLILSYGLVSYWISKVDRLYIPL